MGVTRERASEVGSRKGVISAKVMTTDFALMSWRKSSALNVSDAIVEVLKEGFI